MSRELLLDRGELVVLQVEHVRVPGGTELHKPDAKFVQRAELDVGIGIDLVSKAGQRPHDDYYGKPSRSGVGERGLGLDVVVFVRTLATLLWIAARLYPRLAQ